MLVATARLRMFGFNIWLIVGALLLLIVGLVLLVAGWTGVNIFFWRRGRRIADERMRADRVQSDGTPYPPFSRGICRECGRLVPKVYHLPDGQRLCPDHYQAWRARQMASP